MLTYVDRPAIARIGAVLALLHLVAALVIVSIAVQASSADAVVIMSAAGAAYLLGVRHAFDADHIAAIDVSTRRLADHHRGSWSVGLWFALGHSSVVMIISVTVAVGLPVLGDGLLAPQSPVREVAGAVVPLAMVAFLLAMVVTNAGKLRELRRADADRHVSQATSVTRGPLVAAPLRIVRRPRDTYVVGLVLGLGLDTATDVLLIALTAGAALTQSWVVAVAMPLCFAAGMCTFDSADAVLMRAMYEWASRRPHGRRAYLMAVTWVSLLIGALVAALVAVGWALEWLPLMASIIPPVVHDVAGLDSASLGLGICVTVALLWWIGGRVAARSQPT